MPGMSFKNNKNAIKFIDDSTAESILQGNLSLTKTEHRYTTMYVPGDHVPDLFLECQRHGCEVINGAGRKYKPHPVTYLSSLVHVIGPAVYFVGSSRIAQDPAMIRQFGFVNAANIKKGMQELRENNLAKTVAKTRFLKTTKNPSPQFAHLVAANLPFEYGSIHMINGKQYPYLRQNVALRRVNKDHRHTNKNGLQARRFQSKPLPMSPTMRAWFYPKSRVASFVKSILPARESKEDNELRSTWGFNTNNEQLAHLLYIYHLKKASTQPERTAINKAFNIRASKPKKGRR